MLPIRIFPLAAVALLAFAADDPAVFKSDVALSRVDAQVLDSTGRAITGLNAEDFVMHVNGKLLPIRNFASEAMPLDVLLLLDVSGSMGPHVETVAAASQQALNVLTAKDRVAIMTFDTSTRVRLDFASDHSEVTEELNKLVRSERFNGGTAITKAMMDASRYMEREARPGSRRAIVILTDDQTQDGENEPKVDAALTRSNTVLSFLRAPYEPPTMMGGGRRPSHRGTWGSGGGIGFPGGGIGFPGGGVGFPGGGGGGLGGVDRSHTAGTATIAADSGGDTMDVDNASALEDTLARLRQRYSLNFYMPEDMKTADLQSVQLDLTQSARRRYQNAEVRSRRIFMSGSNADRESGTTVVTRTQPAAEADTAEPSIVDDPAVKTRRRVAVNDSSGQTVNTVDGGGGGPDTTQTPSQPAVKPAPTTPAPQLTTPAKHGGWPSVNDTAPH